MDTIIFASETQQRRYEILAQRQMSMTTYVHDPTLTALGIRESVYFMFNQIGWEGFLAHKHPTHQRLTLEFLSSLIYKPTQGLGRSRGQMSFRLFGFTHQFTVCSLAQLLGFPSSLDAHMETQADEYLNFELNHFWRDIAGQYPEDPDHRDATEIHNPTIRYFHHILAFTFFGKPINRLSVSRDELFIIYCAFQSRPVIGASFMIANMSAIAQCTHGPICVGGLVTMIAEALSLRSSLSRLTPYARYYTMDIPFCFNISLIGNLNPPHFQLLVQNNPVYYFKLPSPEHTSVYTKTNWLYPLEKTDEHDPEREESDPSTPTGYHNYTPLDYSTLPLFTTTNDIPMPDHAHTIKTLQTDVTTLRGELDTVKENVSTLRRDFFHFMDVVTEQFDHIYQHLHASAPPPGGPHA